MKKILVIIPTNDVAEQGCLDAVHAQDYPNYTVMVNVEKRPTPRLQCQKSLYQIINLNAARTTALASDADLFMLLDSDVALPTYALSHLAAQLETPGTEIIGGWYKMVMVDLWVAGRFDGNKNFRYFPAALHGTVKVDMIGLGCLMMTRNVLSAIKFGAGFSTPIQVKGKTTYAGPGIQFALDATAKGFGLFMDGGVIATHLARKKSVFP